MLIRGLHSLGHEHRRCVLTIGNFDGIHRGHQMVLAQLARAGRQLSLPTTLLIFEPQPQEFFAPHRAPARLTRFKEKLLALEALPLDRVLCLRFNQTLANLSAEEFIEQVLVKRLGARYVVVGGDFRFGHHRQGDLSLLEQGGRRFGFEVAAMETYYIRGRRVSSTWIRAALEEGDFATAEQLLGRPYRLLGRVIPGDGRGKGIGFPTANVALHRKTVPVRGVHVARVLGLAAVPLPGVANVGRRPTVEGTHSLLEVHLLDFSQDIYGRQVQVEFVQKLRDEQRFDSIEMLRRQIRRDTENARAYFATETNRDQSRVSGR